jgi:hypothetical protein
LVGVEERWLPQVHDGEVDFGSNIVIPAEGEFTVRKRNLPYDLSIRYGFGGERFEITAATFAQRRGGEPVKSELVRKVPLDRLLRDHLYRHLPPKRGRILVRPDRLVAVYRAAYACHVPPTQAVADAFGITTGAAEQRVFAARNAGHLPKTDQGKAKG